MNYILIEGLALYIFLLMLLLLFVIGVVGFAIGIKGDIKRERLKDELHCERERCISLSRENMRLRLKYGELKAGEKVDV